MRAIESLKTQYRISDFLAWQRDKTLILNPNFQRRSVWKKGAKSYLIDTILKGLPIPIIFLRDLRADLKTFKAKRDVVDGQQRIRTIITYIAPNLLDDFREDTDSFTISRTHNKDYAGMKFADLPDYERQRILDYQFSVHSFNADTDDKEILQIFARMNSTGYKLNDQELRNAEYFGEFKQLCYELATEQLTRWMDWNIFTADDISRMREVELSSELIILMLQGISGRSKANIEKYYSDYDDDFPSKDEISRRFRDIFEIIDAKFLMVDMKKYFSGRSLFYSLFSTIYQLRYHLRPAVEVRSPLSRNQQQLEKARPVQINESAIKKIKIAAEAIHEESAPQQVLRALRGATSDTASRRLVINFFLDIEQ